ncbi:MAG: hypothetical protein ACR2N3_05025 [Pyrinomonadaceae bacterium]
MKQYSSILSFGCVFALWLVLVLACSSGSNSSTQQVPTSSPPSSPSQTEISNSSEVKNSPQPSATPWQKNIKGLGSPTSLPEVSYYTAAPSWRVVVEMLHAWKKEKWQAMVSLTQKSWRDSKQNPAEDLESQFSFMNLLGAEHVSGQLIGPNMAEVKVDVYVSMGGEVRKKRMKVNVVQEQGQWGFNPISAMRLVDE